MQQALVIILLIVKIVLAVSLAAAFIASMAFESEVSRYPSRLSNAMVDLAGLIAFLPFPLAFITSVTNQRSLRTLQWLAAFFACAAASYGMVVWSESFSWRCREKPNDPTLCEWTLPSAALRFEPDKSGPGHR